jgi:Domain of unknown function (DUF4158)
MPVDEESLIRHCSLDHSELDLIQAKRVAHNRLGLAIQLCYLNHRGRTLLPGEEPPARKRGLKAAVRRLALLEVIATDVI